MADMLQKLKFTKLMIHLTLSVLLKKLWDAVRKNVYIEEDERSALAHGKRNMRNTNVK